MKPKNKSKENKVSKIPKTGKIGALAKNIEKETERSIVLKVMQDVEQFESTSNRSEKAEWIKGAIKRLEHQVSKEKKIKIMENRGRDCFGPKHSEHAKQLMNKSKSIEEFLNKWSRGGVSFILKDKSTIIGEYNKCYCSLVNQIKKPFPTKTFCYCGVGYIKQLFESAFEKPVEVELVQSVITGAKTCKFIIHI